MRNTALEEIKKEILPLLIKANVKKAALFGSYTKGTQTSTSDIDILVDFPRGKTLLDLVELKQNMEEKLKRKVDIVTFQSVHPLLKDSILQNQYSIF